MNSRLIEIRDIPFPEISAAQLFRSYGSNEEGFILDSIQSGNHARYSYISIGPPEKFIVVRGSFITIRKKNGTLRKFRTDDFLRDLSRMIPRKIVPLKRGLPPFLGGAVGYISYDAGRFFDRFRLQKRDRLGVPDAVFGIFENLIALDLRSRKAWWIGSGKMRGKVKENEAQVVAGSAWSASQSREEFCQAVRKAQRYISAGDIYQANLSIRISANYTGDPMDYFERLTKINPSPFSCYLRFLKPSLSLSSCSPELLLRKRGNLIETRPIAGTRPRGKTSQEDVALSGDLLLSEKERAEHLMLVDLERNDLGRVCQPGTVRVKESFVIERYSHVMHIVSHIVGRLRQNKTGWDALRASFPGGTVSGCPKLRAVEVIDQLESFSRGPFFGSAGWVGYDGDMDFNILIRSALIHKGQIHVQAGAGIVADSVPEREYEESLKKAEALLLALQSSSNSFRPWMDRKTSQVHPFLKRSGQMKSTVLAE